MAIQKCSYTVCPHTCRNITHITHLHHVLKHQAPASLPLTTPLATATSALLAPDPCPQQAARDRFNEFLRDAAVPAEDADVEKLRKERREAAAKGGAGAGEELPEAFWKLPRIRLLLILCKEVLRINKWVWGGLAGRAWGWDEGTPAA
jgi:hypothetical protein